MTREQSYIYLLKQIRKMIDMALGEPEENIQYDSLEPNYGRQDNEQKKENKSGTTGGQSPLNQSHTCKVCD